MKDVAGKELKARNIVLFSSHKLGRMCFGVYDYITGPNTVLINAVDFTTDEFNEEIMSVGTRVMQVQLAQTPTLIRERLKELHEFKPNSV